jgi:hypothetical protein
MRVTQLPYFAPLQDIHQKSRQFCATIPKLFVNR